MKVKVIKIYRDKHNRTLHTPGEEIKMSKGRFEEINSTARGIFVAEIKPEKQRKVKSRRFEMEASEELLSDVKDYLDITWDDEATDKKISGIIERGKKYLDRVAGTELDYDVEDKPKELLLDYCRYVRSGALEEFQKNFLSELLSLQIQKECEAYKTENANV